MDGEAGARMKEYQVTFVGGACTGGGLYMRPTLTVPLPGGASGRVHIGCVRIEQLTSENSKSMGGAAVAGIAGGLLLGPAGLIAGALAGGNKQLVSFVVEFEDGQKAVAQAHPTLFAKMVGDTFSSECIALDQPKPGSANSGCAMFAGVLILAAAIVIFVMKATGMA